MKTILIALTVVVTAGFSEAAVLLVNNTNNGPGQYTQIDAAIAAATPGDTIYVSGSSTSYGSCTITKSIALLGAGTFAEKQNNSPSKVDAITMNSNVTGVVIQGFYFTYGVKFMSKTNINNVLISYNYFISNDAINIYGLSNSSNLMISNNIFDVSSSGVIMYCSNTSGVSNVTIENNIIKGSISTLNVTNALIKNNVFYNHLGTSGSGAFYNYNGGNVTNAQIINNIFYNSHPSNFTTACVFQNNITYSSTATYPTLDSLSNNLNNVNPLFVSVPVTGGFLVTNNFHLQNGSPAIGTGLGGTDMGFYGGNNPVTFTGEIYGIPVVRQMNLMNSNVPQNGNVNVKVRSTKPREH